MPERPKVFRDPIHQNIEFSTDSGADGLVLQLIDTPQVQRLRRVRQLGLASLVYHGAEHSRFTHTLGVAHLARRLYVSSMRNSGQQIDELELAIVLAAATLHDTGHPPFSHAVEKELRVGHEKATVAIIRGDTEVHRVLADFGNDSFVESVAAHIDGSSDAPTVDIISSQLDADRMDYLLRDGYHAGVPNSRYDVERIIQMGFMDQEGVAFDERALYAIEGYFTARYHLYLQLYYHKTVRAAEVILRALIARAGKLASIDKDLGEISPYLDQLLRHRRSEDSTQIVDAEFWSAFNVWARDSEDAILKDLSQRLLNRNLFRAVDIPISKSAAFYEDVLPKIEAAARDRGMDPEYYVRTDTASDSPYKIADLDASLAVRLRDSAGHMHRLELQSKLVTALGDSAYQKFRCCVPLELRAVVTHLVSTL